MSEATVTLKYKLDGTGTVVTDLNQITASASKTDAATKNLSATAQKASLDFKSMHASLADFARAGASASQIVQLTGTSIQSATKAVREYSGSLAKGEYDTRGLRAAQAQLAEAGLKAGEAFKQNTNALTLSASASGNAAKGLNSVRAATASLAASALGAAPGVTQLGSAIGVMGLGTGPMIAVLGGVAALGFAWNKLTEDARKAKEEHKKLLEVLDSLVDKEKFSLQNSYDANVKLLGVLVQQRAAVVQQREELKTARGGKETGLVALGFSSKLSDLDKDIATVKGRVEAGTREVEQIYRDSTERQAEERKRADEKKIADLKRSFDEYSRIAKEREDKAFDDAERQALFARVSAGFGRLGVQTTTDRGFHIPDPAVLHDLRDTAQRYQLSVRDAADASSDLLRNFGATGREMADLIQSANSLVPVIQRIAQMGGLSRGGSVALGAGVAGYSSGGVLSGAASGALVGAQLGGPWGAVAGGLIGAGAGLLGAAKSLRDAADSIRASRNREGEFIDSANPNGVRDARHSLNVQAQDLLNTLREQFSKGAISAEEFNRRWAAVQGAYARKWDEVANQFWASIGEQFNALSGPAGEYLNAQNAIQRAYIESRKNAEAAGATQEDLNRIEELRVLQLAKLRNELEQAASSGLLSRFASLTGASAPTQTGNRPFLGDSEYLRPLFDNFTKYLDKIEATKKAAETSAYYDQITAQIAQQQLQTSQEQLRAAEASVSGLTQTLEAIRRTSASLALGSLSPLNARQRYGVANSELESQFRLALSGGPNGQKAAQGIGSFIDSFLGVSKERFASGTPYANDYERAQSMLRDLERIYGPQLTAEEKTLAELKKHTDLLTKQLSTQDNALVQQLVQRATDHGNEANRIAAILHGMGHQLTQDVTYGPGGANPTGQYYATPGYTPPQQGTPSYQARWDAYVAAHGGNPDLTTSEWIAAGMPAYARGTSWHRGGVAMVGERGPELVRMPTGSSVTNSDQFAAPIVAEQRALRQEFAALRHAFAEQTAELRRAINARNN